MAQADGEDMPLFVEDRTQRIHVLGALPDQSLSTSEHNGPGLLINCFRSHKAHLGLPRRDDNRFGISRIVFLTLDERSNVLRRDQFNPMTQCLHLTRPVAGATTSLKNDQAGRLLRHEHAKLFPRQLFAELRLAGR